MRPRTWTCCSPRYGSCASWPGPRAGRDPSRSGTPTACTASASGGALHGRLPRLVRYDRRGALGPAERDRFADLRAELRDVAPLAERLGLAVPRRTASGDVER
ncbi:hypothetical protein ACR6C2_36300 [Streptomyces sp. INA 01156]